MYKYIQLKILQNENFVKQEKEQLFIVYNSFKQLDQKLTKT